MPAIDEKQFREILASAEVSGLFLLAGEEKYLVKRGAKRLIAKAAPDAFPSFNDNRFTNDSSVDSIADAALALPFMAERKCVSVADFNINEKSKDEQTKLLELIDDLPETTTLLFWYPTVDPKSGKGQGFQSFLERARKKGHVLMCEHMDNSQLYKFLMNTAGKQDCFLPRPSAVKLVEYAGSDLSLLTNEMEKLCSFARSQRSEDDAEKPAEITEAMIERLVPKSTETKTYSMTDALIAEKYDTAYKLLDELFAQKTEARQILGALASSYIDLYRVKAALESGKTATAPTEYAYYPKNTRFRLDKAQRSVRGVSVNTLRKSLDLILEADLALKGSSPLEPRTVLERLIAKLLLAAKGEEL